MAGAAPNSALRRILVDLYAHLAHLLRTFVILSLSLMFIFANGTGRSKISRGHWTLVLVSA